MADTLGNMVRRIRVDINRGAAHDTRIKEAIVDAIRFYRARRFGWNQKRATTVLYPGIEYISPPDGWLEVDSLILEDGDNREPLTERTFDWIDDTSPTVGYEGRPDVFAVQNRQVRLYPTPDRSYSLVMSFLYELRDVSASASDGATNAWMSEGEQLIRKHATAELLIYYIGGEQAALGYAMRKECSDEIAPALEMQAARETTTGRLRAWL